MTSVASLLPAPLFEPQWTRDIIVNLTSTNSLTGPPDIDQLVDVLARGKPVLAIPRTPMPTLARGVQVLSDLGDAMEPFAADQDLVLASLRSILGKDLVQVVYFRDCPTRDAGTGPTWTWSRYKAPAPGQPILVLSDLGVGGPTPHPSRAGASEWYEFVRTRLQEGSRVITLNPYAPSRWPELLGLRTAILHWDRRASPRRAAMVKRIAERLL